ncbi:glycosyltransferase family 4 protein [Deferrisoma camini]|uniref:glycosyltransferase family 4 protein n=1 Tax=Deferrisoma camini TaxID=1035120 RepID=UPI00046CFF1A|nr:glycosyltransferase family 4 protein [Deferrisoma camini]
MRALFIASYFPPIAGGSAVVYENLCRHLGDAAAVLAPWRYYMDGREVEGWREADRAQPFPVRRVELLRPVVKPAPRHALQSAWRLLTEDLPLRRRVLREALRAVDAHGADVVVLGELVALSWLGPALRRRRGVAIVHYIHGEEVTTRPTSRLYGRHAFRHLRQAEAVVAVSSFTRDELVRRGVPAERIHVITNGVDLKRFTPGPKDPEIVERHGLQGKKVLLTVARIEERKGHDKVIEALPAIAEKVPKVVYLIVGKGGYRPRLEELAREHGVADRVVFTGLVPWDDLPRYYRTCDVFVMPNRTLPNGDTEGFGLVFLEANACGKPVIGGRAGGVPDAVVHGETGLLVDGASAQEVGRAVLRLLLDPELRLRMANSGLSRAREFSWAHKGDEFSGVCRRFSRHSVRSSFGSSEKVVGKTDRV